MMIYIVLSIIMSTVVSNLVSLLSGMVQKPAREFVGSHNQYPATASYQYRELAIPRLVIISQRGN